MYTFFGSETDIIILTNIIIIININTEIYIIIINNNIFHNIWHITDIKPDKIKKHFIQNVLFYC